MNYNKRKLSSPVPSSSIKWQRLDGSMIGNQHISTEAELSSSSSSSEGGDTIEPTVMNRSNNLSCGQAAAQSSSLSIIDNILPSNSNIVAPKNMIKQPPQTHPAAQPINTQVAAHPQKTTSSATNTIALPPSSTMAAAAAALRCNKKSMVQSPNDFFMANLRSRGYPATTFCSLKSGYHNTPTVSYIIACIYNAYMMLFWFAVCSLSQYCSNFLLMTPSFALSPNNSYLSLSLETSNIQLRNITNPRHPILRQIPSSNPPLHRSQPQRM